MQYGLPGFFLLMMGYLPTLWWIGRRNFDADLQLWQLRRAWMFTFSGLTLTLCTVHIWTSIFSFVFFLFGAGMWFLTAEPASATQQGTSAQSASRLHTPYARSLSKPQASSAPVNRDQRPNPSVNVRPAASFSKPRSKEILYTRPKPPSDA